MNYGQRDFLTVYSSGYQQVCHRAADSGRFYWILQYP